MSDPSADYENRAEEVHRQSLGEKPATIVFREDDPRSTWDVDYVDPNDGHLFVRDGERGIRYLPWGVIGEVRRDV